MTEPQLPTPEEPDPGAARGDHGGRTGREARGAHGDAPEAGDRVNRTHWHLGWRWSSFGVRVPDGRAVEMAVRYIGPFALTTWRFMPPVFDYDGGQV